MTAKRTLYGVARRPCLIISSWFCTSSFTRSMGADTVLEIPAATPPSMKSSKKPSFCFLAGAAPSAAANTIWAFMAARGDSDMVGADLAVCVAEAATRWAPKVLDPPCQSCPWAG